MLSYVLRVMVTTPPAFMNLHRVDCYKVHTSTAADAGDDE